MVGSKVGSELGSELGSADGSELGSVVGSAVGVVVGEFVYMEVSTILNEAPASLIPIKLSFAATRATSTLIVSGPLDPL